MYLQNKYTKWYNNIIQKARCRPGPLNYTEKHHIIPKSLSGSDDKVNLDVLTAREHFICHLLLPKMTTGTHRRSMWHALWKIINQQTIHQHRYKVTSRMYSIIREHNAAALSESNSGKPNLTARNKPKSDEHKTKLSIALTGYKWSAERNDKIRRAHIGKKQPPRSQKWIDNQRQSTLSNRRICEFCNKDVSFKGYQRWHGERCNNG